MPFLHEIQTHRTRFIKTLFLWSGFLAVGMSVGMKGATLLDLRQQVQTSLTGISYALASRAAGFVIGSLLLTLIYSRINFQLATSIAFLTGAVITFTMPLTAKLWQLLLAFALNGICMGFVEAGSSVFMLQVWGKEASHFIQALQLMYGAGSLVAPLIAEPFLANYDQTMYHAANSSSEVMYYPGKTKLIFPYAILACFMAFNAIAIFVMWISHPETADHPSRSYEDLGSAVISKASIWNRDERSEEDVSEFVIEKSVDHYDKEYTLWKIVMIILVIIFMHIYLGLQIAFGSYLMTFAVHSDLRLSKRTGAYLCSLFWSTFTITKLWTIFFVQEIGNELSIVMSLAVLMLANVILFLYGNESEILLWIGVALVGIGISSIFGCLFGYMEGFFRVTDQIGSLVVLSGVMGELTFPFIISPLIEDFPQVLLWVLMICTVALTLLFSMIMIICRMMLKA